MSQILIAIAAFLVAIGILVAVHEWGHYFVARRLGVGVIRYSIGFGKKIVGYTSRKTGIEYQLSMLPLGGYVKLLDENEAPVAAADQPRALNRAHPARRIAIVAAGPGVNFLFAIAAYWLVLVIGVAGFKPVIGPVADHSLASTTSLQAKDQIVAVDGRPIDSWRSLRLSLIDHALDNDRVVLTIERGDDTRRSTTLDLSQAPDDPKQLFKRLGIAPYQPPATPIVRKVESGSPAAKAGLVDGDRITAMAGQSIASPTALVKAIRQRPGQSVGLTVKRGDQTLHPTVTLGSQPNSSSAGNKATHGHLGIGIGVDAKAWDQLRTTRRLGPIAAVPAAASQTWDLSFLTVRLLGRMVIGDVSWHNIGGPIQIADYAGKTASIGFVAFVSFLALISLSLGVINLLPIPVLDGGHILYYLAEWIRGRPLSQATQMLGQRAGIGALVALMCLAFYNDIFRLLG